jgi:hypothetical protein
MSEPASVGQGFKTASREFVTIVAGVLCALAAQAWWQGREDHSREREYLRQLLSETEANQARLEDAIRRDSIAGESLERLSEALFGDDPLPAAATLTEWISDGAWASNAEFQPLSGTFTALVSSGDLRLIRTDSLRALLVGYSAHLAHAESQLRLFVEQSFGSPNQMAVALPFLPRLFFDADSFAAPDYGALRRSIEAQGWFFALSIAKANRLSRLRRLREDTDRLYAALMVDAAER